MRFVSGLLFVVGLYISLATAGEIRLVYPRMENPADTFTYKNGIDSTFLLGSIDPPAGQLEINGFPTKVNSQGAFLAYLPLAKGNGTKYWRLTLTQGEGKTGKLDFPYLFQSERAKHPDSTGVVKTKFPCVIEVTQANAHTRTSLSGSYQFFPQVGTRLTAESFDDGFYRFRIADGYSGYVESKFVKVSKDSSVTPATIGNGYCSHRGDTSFVVLSLNKPVLWTSDLSADSKTISVLLCGTNSATDRLRYTINDSFLHEVVWSQLPEGVRIEFRLTKPMLRGFDLSYSSDSLHFRVCNSFRGKFCSLKGKTIVLDPGHGGKSAGSIGAMGTKEKDVTLRWSQILAKTLERKGAIVKVTRATDEDVDLYKRVDFGAGQRTDFFLSLHCNALPDGENPLIRHGLGTYYYQSGSRRAAEILHKRLLSMLALRDDGLYDANLAVVRPTVYPAVLLEAAYLIYPEEEGLLRSDLFLQKLADSITKGLEDYFKYEP